MIYLPSFRQTGTCSTRSTRMLIHFHFQLFQRGFGWKWIQRWRHPTAVTSPPIATNRTTPQDSPAECANDHLICITRMPPSENNIISIIIYEQGIVRRQEPMALAAVVTWFRQGDVLCPPPPSFLAYTRRPDNDRLAAPGHPPRRPLITGCPSPKNATRNHRENKAKIKSKNGGHFATWKMEPGQVSTGTRLPAVASKEATSRPRTC